MEWYHIFMARLNINNIENVEGKYHVMFFEGKNLVEQTKTDLRFAWFALLLFLTVLLIFVIVSGFNLFYIGFLAVFLVFFIAVYVYLKREMRKGKKQCIYAVQNSKTTEIIAKQIDNRKVGRKIVKSVSNEIDKFDVDEKYPSFLKKYKRRRKQSHLAGIIIDFENEEKKKEK